MIYAATQSLCPVCLNRVDAAYEERPAGSMVVELVKTCPAHGIFRTPVWRGEPLMQTWRRPKKPSYPRRPVTSVDRGCPFDCGLCPEHAQHTCTGQIEVTGRCDLGCPVCYAESGASSGDDPPLSLIKFQLDCLWQASGACNVQLSGGEPTMRDDLPDIIHTARQRGFPFVQLNSNGLRLGREPGYARLLADAGLDSVYLQCDGADDDVYRRIRGRACAAEKHAAIMACADAGLGVVLVATLVQGVNVAKIGDLLRMALDMGPAVRGLHMQPAASFGRFPWDLAAAPRVTLPEVMRELETQSQGMLHVTDFHPPGCEHALCSFSAVYRRTPAGLALLKNTGACCDSGSSLSRPVTAATPEQAENSPELVAEEGARRAKAFTARHWSSPPAIAGPAAVDGKPGAAASVLQDDFDRFLARAGIAGRFTVSCMAFQDALTLDVERVRGCCIHVVSGQGELVPFCLYNLTARDGSSLYRKPDHAVRA